MKLFSDKKTRYRNLILVLLPFLLLGGFFGFMGYRAYKSLMSGGEDIENSPKYSAADYGYQLRADATQLQYDTFQELTAALNEENVDDVKVATYVAESFAADMYTWSNKGGKYDVGGMCYLYSGRVANAYADAVDYFYHYINYYIDEYGKENLPEVNGFTVLEANALGDQYTIDGTSHPWYFVRLEWTYAQKDGGYDTSDLCHGEDFYIIKNSESGRYEIVQVFEVTE